VTCGSKFQRLEHLPDALQAELGITPGQALGSPLFLLGTLDEITAQLETLRARSGISYVSVFPGDVEPFAPVVARLAGR
jgi:hypothetical protein